MRRFFCALVVLLGSGCEDRVEVVRWTPLPYEELLVALDEPTARTTDAVALIDAVDDLPRLLEVIRLLDDLRSLIGTVVEGPGFRGFFDEPELGRVQGTNVFVEVSCPGPDLRNPDVAFESGRLHLESPSTLEEALDEFRVEGDILVTAEDCQLGPVLVTGTTPGFVDEQNGRIALDTDLEFELEGGGSVRFAAPLVISRDDVRLLLPVDDERWFTVEFDFGESQEVSVRGEDGSVTCELTRPLPRCDLE